MKKVLFNQSGNPMISKSVNGHFNSGAQTEDAIHENMSLALKDATAMISSLPKKGKYDENLLYFKKRQILNGNGDLRIKDYDFGRNYSHQLNELLAEYLMSHFTLYELYVVFFQYQSAFGFDVVKEAKQVSIESIDSEADLLNPRQLQRLKKMVWDMNPIWFGLILNFVMVTNLFWDEKTQKIIRPEFKLSK